MVTRSTKMKLTLKRPTLQSRLLLMWLGEVFILTVIRYILTKLGIYEGYTRSLIILCVSSIPLLLCFVQILAKKIKDWQPFLVVFLFVLVSIAISILKNDALLEYFLKPNYGFDRILRPDCAIYAFLFFSIFRNPKEIIKNLKIFAYVDFIYLIIVQLIPALLRGYWIDVGPSGREIHLAYSLSFGYGMTFPVIIFLYCTIKQKRISSLLASIAGIWIIFTQGNRGALMLPIIFIGFMVISTIIDSKNVSRKILKISVVIVGVITVVVWGEEIIKCIGIMLKEIGISSRSIDMLIQGEFTNDNGRERIWNTVLEAIRRGSIWGYGVLGDRPFVAPLHYVGYSHNLFLEIIISYGIIGVVFCLYIVWDVIQMVFFCKDTNWRELYIILLAASCQLILSMSFWYVWEFWAALAVAYQYKKIYKKRQK